MTENRQSSLTEFFNRVSLRVIYSCEPNQVGSVSRLTNI